MTLPFISVVIPNRNRSLYLYLCLRSFLDIEYPANRWEIIVVNDGGDNSFDRLDSELRARLPIQIIESQGHGPASARNTGVSHAQGDLIAFTDDDCRVDSQWLSAFSAGMAANSSVVLGGQLLNPYSLGPFSAAWFEYMVFLQELIMVSDHGSCLMLMGNNAIYDRAIFLKR